jgi:hypothetical protein
LHGLYYIATSHGQRSVGEWSNEEVHAQAHHARHRDYLITEGYVCLPKNNMSQTRPPIVLPNEHSWNNQSK